MFNIKSGTKVDVEKVKKVEEFFKDEKNASGFHGVVLETNEDGMFKGIGVEEYYSEFSDDELFATSLSEILVSGEVDLMFTGEDGISWGYKVLPNKVIEMVSVFLTMDEVKEVEELLGKKLSYIPW
jgi:hypothetical protein